MVSNLKYILGRNSDGFGFNGFNVWVNKQCLYVIES